MIATLATTILGGLTGWMKNKQEVAKAVASNKARMALSEQSHNNVWELKALMNSGWKDEVLFLFILAIWIASAFFPDHMEGVFKNWELIPEGFKKVTYWVVGSVLGIKKASDYAPGLISGVTTAVTSVLPSKKLKCSYCGDRFQNMRSLTSHINSCSKNPRNREKDER